MKNTQPSQCDEIWHLAGKALFACQFVEHNLTMLCGMLQTSVDVSPRSNPEIYGNLKERTASFQWLRKALAETGIVADHYLFPEIDEVFRRRDWLAHRVFLESTSSRQTTREFQIQGLEELSVMAYRLFRVLYAVAQHVAERIGGADPLPDEHVVRRLTAPYLEEAEEILKSMTSRQNGHDPDSKS
jgi:hypothetical protein